jgi:hypothetical protein
MNRRTLLGLGLAAAVVAGGALLWPSTPGDVALEGRPQGGGALVFPELAARLGSVASIEVDKPDSTLRIRRSGDRWVLPDKDGYPVRPERVRELLVGLTELRLQEARTADGAQLGRLGLDDPRAPGSTGLLLRLADGNGTTVAALIIGRRRVRTQGNLPESAYVRRPDENQAWLAEGRLPVDADPQLWLDRDIANLGASRLLRLTVRRQDTEALVLARSPDDPDAPLVIEGGEAPGGEPDEAALDGVARAFEFLTLLDVRAAPALSAVPFGEVRAEMTSDLAIAVTLHRMGEDLWITLDAAGETDEARRLRARWQGWAFQVASWKERAFLPRIEELAPPAGPPATAPVRPQ